jgi:hypothetical protein
MTPAVLAGFGVVLAVVLIALFAVRSTASEDERLASQLESWTTCLRSEGAPVPLIEPIGDRGFRVTVDDLVLDVSFDYDSISVAFEKCLDDAPVGVQSIAAVIDGLSSLPFAVGDIEWLGPLLFEIDGSGGSGGPGMDTPPFGDPPLAELCEQLSDLELVLPDVARELVEMCEAEPNV